MPAGPWTRHRGAHVDDYRHTARTHVEQVCRGEQLQSHLANNYSHTCQQLQSYRANNYSHTCEQLPSHLRATWLRAAPGRVRRQGLRSQELPAARVARRKELPRARARLRAAAVRAGGADAAGQTLAPTSAPAHLAVISLVRSRAQKSLRHTAEDAAAVFQYRGQNPFFRAEIERHSQAGSRGAGAASRRRPVRNVSALGRTGHALGDGGRR